MLPQWKPGRCNIMLLVALMSMIGNNFPSWGINAKKAYPWSRGKTSGCQNGTCWIKCYNIWIILLLWGNQEGSANTQAHWCSCSQSVRKMTLRETLLAFLYWILHFVWKLNKNVYLYDIGRGWRFIFQTMIMLCEKSSKFICFHEFKKLN